METEIKKRKRRKGGTDYAKEKLAKAEAKVMTLESQLANAKEEARRTKYELEKKLNEEKETVRKQGSKISDLSARLSVAQGNEEEWKRKYNEALAHVPFWRRWLHGL